MGGHAVAAPAPESVPRREGATDETSGARARVPLGLGLAVSALVLLPVVVALARTVGHRWVPVDDFAIIDLRVRDVWSGHPPLTGLLSRNGWNHPGPAQFWFTALVSGATGQHAWATRVGGTLLQLGALVWLLAVTWRRSTRLLLAAAAVTAMTYLALGPWLLTQPWNLWVPLPWFILFVFLAWIATDGAFGQVVALSIAGSFLVQTHVGYAPLVLAGFAWVGGCAGWDARRQGAPPRWRTIVGISAAVWVVTWIPPIVDALLDWPGNLGAIAGYFVRGEKTAVGLADALGLMAAEFRNLPPWLGGSTQINPLTGAAIPESSALLLVPIVLLVAAAVLGRGGARVDRRGVALAGLLLVVGILTISRADEARAYTFQWRVVIAAYLVVACVWALAAVLEPRLTALAHRVAIVSVVAFVAWGSVSQAVRIDPDVPVMRDRGEVNDLEARRPTMDAVVRQLRANGELDRPRPVRVVSHGIRGLFDGVVDELDRDGFDVRVADSLGAGFGSQRTLAAKHPVETWHITEHRNLLTGVMAQPGSKVIAAVTPLAPAQDAALTELQRRLVRELHRVGRPDLVDRIDSPYIGYLVAGSGIAPGLVREVATLNARVGASGCRCAIVAVPGSDPH